MSVEIKRSKRGDKVILHCPVCQRPFKDMQALRCHVNLSHYGFWLEHRKELTRG